MMHSRRQSPLITIGDLALMVGLVCAADFTTSLGFAVSTSTGWCR